MPASINILDQHFGKWTVIAPSLKRTKNGAILWLCKCDCGIERLVTTGHLRHGNSKSCGCSKIEAGEKRIHDLTNKRYGRLIVIKRAKKRLTPHRGYYWLCKCDCGKIKTIRSCSLVTGSQQSCGCLGRENRIQSQAKRRLPYGVSMLNRLYHGYKRGAKARNHEFSLSKDEFQKLTSEICHYCGNEPSQIMSMPQSNGDYVYNGLDRKDNNLGYTFDNIVPCCWECNKIKLSMNYDTFIKWIKRINFHWKHI